MRAVRINQRLEGVGFDNDHRFLFRFFSRGDAGNQKKQKTKIQSHDAPPGEKDGYLRVPLYIRLSGPLPGFPSA
jgi:hypothetical protein